MARLVVDKDAIKRKMGTQIGLLEQGSVTIRTPGDIPTPEVQILFRTEEAIRLSLKNALFPLKAQGA